MRHGRELAAQGAAILDVGGSRPARAPSRCPAEEGLHRVLGVVEQLAAEARRARLHRHHQGARGRAPRWRWAPPWSTTSRPSASPPELAGVVADAGVECCLMHMLGDPRTMQEDPRYDDVVAE